MGGALNTWVMGAGWLLGSGVLTVYLLWPADVPPRRHAGGLSRLLRGHLGIGGTLRVGIMLAAALWWATAAGLVNADAVRIGVVLVLGAGAGVALVNAGRRAALSVPWAMALGAALGGGMMGLLHLSVLGYRLVMRGGLA